MFYVGQKVVCVKDDALPFSRSDLPIAVKAGSIYTIRNIDDESAAIDGIPGLWLQEIVHPPKMTWLGVREVSYCASRFRPVVERKTDISIFTEMLKPKERELARN